MIFLIQNESGEAMLKYCIPLAALLISTSLSPLGTLSRANRSPAIIAPAMVDYSMPGRAGNQR
ncbi:MAG TPA: hypothetical protein DCS07_08550 [Bdellovibrionales bacterium]|nr:hypothetical protein [Bdellovibrionales bacterium]HCM41035.1 hypothetical protein [Bdellovibrionales bacterium]